MSYALFVSPSGHTSLRKLPTEVKRLLQPEMQRLADEPMLGSPLQGALRFLRSLHIMCRGVQYRVAYEVDEVDKEILIHYVSTRENFYKELARLKVKPLSK